MKRILKSSLLLVAVAAAVAGGTGAFFSDTETSTGNVFTAGNIDLMVNHSAASYNGENCVINCAPTGGNLIENGSFETPTVTANGGGYQFFNSIPDWTLEAGSVVEVQRNAFASADGLQHVELDGDEPNPATTISQTIATVPGERYRLSFQHSPRPQSQAAGSGIRLEVEVVSPSGTTFSDTITTGTGAIDWSTYTYEFVANDVTTTIRFAYDGTVNTFGGLLDDVRVFQLACDGGAYEDTPGGFCELWDSKDLANEKFFQFADVKPQDTGTNLISMLVESNESYLCLAVDNHEELENSYTDPEIAAGDLTNDEGELGEFLMVAGWYSDENGNKGDLLFAPTAVADLSSIAFADSTTSNGPVQPGVIEYAHLEWCLGDMTVSGNTVSCDGNVPNINQTQTDAFVADLQFYAVQSRNNDDFRCDAVVFPGDEEEEEGGPQVLGISANDIAQDFPTIEANPTKWFFFEDGSGIANPFMTINQYSLSGGENDIVEGPEGVGAAKMLLHDNSRYNIATYQFANTPLASITNLQYRVYDASSSSETPYLHFNVDFDGDDDWQRRLVMVPTVSGNGGVPLNTWTTVDAIAGGSALWCWSGMTACGGSGTEWPAQTGTPFANPNAQYQTWSDIVAAYPGIALRGNDPFFGVRVGHPGPVGEESYVDWVEFNGVQYNFEN